MTSKTPTPLARLLKTNDIAQCDMARAISQSEAQVSRLVSGDGVPSKASIDSILSYLTSRLGRPVTYEEVFGSPVAAAGGKR